MRLREKRRKQQLKSRKDKSITAISFNFICHKLTYKLLHISKLNHYVPPYLCMILTLTIFLILIE